MYTEEIRHKWASWRLGTMMLMIVTLILLLAACGVLEPHAPERSFTPEDLLVDRDVIPPAWESFGLVFPAGDDLCTTECASIQFGVADRELPIQAVHYVYRYLSAGIAQRKFDRVYLPQVEHFESVNEWTHQSPVADQSYFGCYDWEGRATPVCEWAGRYEEYIVVFWTRMTPGEVSLADIERAVRAIDKKMAQYLGKPLEDTED